VLVISSILLLLVEDEALIRELLETALTEAGFELIVATNGEQALAELETDASRFRAVITDIKFGAGPDGWEVGRRAREIIADMPVVYMSGDSAHDWASKGVPNSIMVTKPFAPAQIITAVSTLLNQVDSH
jgi:DNA-binding response OmpR family regulator